MTAGGIVVAMQSILSFGLLIGLSSCYNSVALTTKGRDNHPNHINPLHHKNYTLVTTSTESTAQVGEVVFLPCDTQGDLGQELQASWVRRKDWHILTSGSTIYTKEQRYSLQYSPESTKWTLVIKYIRQSDAGVYECQIVGEGGSLSHLVTLNVITPRAVITGNGEHHVDAGSTIALECYFEQMTSPPQYIFWYHNSQMINYDTERGGITVSIEVHPRIRSTLTISNAGEDDSGNYTCDGANAEADSISVYITQVNQIAAIQSRGSSSSTHDRCISHYLLVSPILATAFLVWECVLQFLNSNSSY